MSYDSLFLQSAGGTATKSSVFLFAFDSRVSLDLPFAGSKMLPRDREVRANGCITGNLASRAKTWWPPKGDPKQQNVVALSLVCALPLTSIAWSKHIRANVAKIEQILKQF